MLLFLIHYFIRIIHTLKFSRQRGLQLKYNLHPLNVLSSAIEISHDDKQSLAILGMQKDIDGLGYFAGFSYPADFSNIIVALVSEG